MGLWAYILGGFLALSLIVLITLALAFSYQKIHCIADKRIICWADWTCPEGGGTNVLQEYFMKYSDKCLFNSNPDSCNCGSNGASAPPPDGDKSDMGYYESAVANPALNNQQNPYDTTSASTAKAYTTAAYGTADTYNNSPQNLCGNVYPVNVNAKPAT